MFVIVCHEDCGFSFRVRGAKKKKWHVVQGSSENLFHSNDCTSVPVFRTSPKDNGAAPAQTRASHRRKTTRRAAAVAAVAAAAAAAAATMDYAESRDEEDDEAEEEEDTYESRAPALAALAALAERIKPIIQSVRTAKAPVFVYDELRFLSSTGNSQVSQSSQSSHEEYLPQRVRRSEAAENNDALEVNGNHATATTPKAKRMRDVQTSFAQRALEPLSQDDDQATAVEPIDASQVQLEAWAAGVTEKHSAATAELSSLSQDTTTTLSSDGRPPPNTMFNDGLDDAGGLYRVPDVPATDEMRELSHMVPDVYGYFDAAKKREDELPSSQECREMVAQEASLMLSCSQEDRLNTEA